MTWILNLAVELVSASAAVSVTSAILAFLLRGTKTTIAINTPGKRLEFSGVISSEDTKKITELMQELKDAQQRAIISSCMLKTNV